MALTPFWPFGIPLSRSPGEGCESDKTEDREYGKFAWVMDPDGNKVELWEDPNRFQVLSSFAQCVPSDLRDQPAAVRDPLVRLEHWRTGLGTRRRPWTYIVTGYPDFASALEAVRGQVDDDRLKPCNTPEKLLVSNLDRLQSPDFVGVFLDGAVRREPAHVSYIED